MPHEADMYFFRQVRFRICLFSYWEVFLAKYRRSNTNRKKEPDDLVNEKIRFREVLVIGPNGDQLGTMSRYDALNKAYDMGLDLV